MIGEIAPSAVFGYLQVAASIKAGLTLQQQMQCFFDVGNDCRRNGVNGRLRRVLKSQLQK